MTSFFQILVDVAFGFADHWKPEDLVKAAQDVGRVLTPSAAEAVFLQLGKVAAYLAELPAPVDALQVKGDTGIPQDPPAEGDGHGP